MLPLSVEVAYEGDRDEISGCRPKCFSVKYQRKKQIISTSTFKSKTDFFRKRLQNYKKIFNHANISANILHETTLFLVILYNSLIIRNLLKTFRQ